MNTETPAPVVPVKDPHAHLKAREYVVKITVTTGKRVVGSETAKTTGHNLTSAARAAAVKVATPIEAAWRAELGKPL